MEGVEEDIVEHLAVAENEQHQFSIEGQVSGGHSESCR